MLKKIRKKRTLTEGIKRKIELANSIALRGRKIQFRVDLMRQFAGLIIFLNLLK